MPVGLPPEDIPPDIKYKCHPNQTNSTVFCVLCEGTYHKSDFNKKKNGKYISHVMVVCNEHTELELDDTNKERVILMKLKKELFENKKELDKLKKDYNALNAEFESLQVKYNNLNNDTMDVSINADLNKTVQQSEYCDFLHKENELLKKLNSEMNDKNLLLKELLSKEKESNKNSVRSYAQTLSSNNNNTQTKIVPKIVIKKKNEGDDTDIKATVLRHIAEDKTILTKSIDINKSKDEIVISCVNTDSVNLAETLLCNKLSNICTIEKEKPKNPIIKIIGFDNSFDWDQSSIEDDINNRNFQEDKGKILQIYQNNLKNTTTIIMEVTGNIHKMIKENKDKVCVGYQSCRVYDVINAKPCYKCGRFNHSGYKCDNEPECMRCAGAHLTVNCKEFKNFCCPNCLYTNNQYNKNLDTNHIATDVEKCEILKKKISLFLKNTDYIVNPNIPKQLGFMKTKKKEKPVSNNSNPTAANKTEVRITRSKGVTAVSQSNG